MNFLVYNTKCFIKEQEIQEATLNPSREISANCRQSLGAESLRWALILQRQTELRKQQQSSII